MSKHHDTSHETGLPLQGLQRQRDGEPKHWQPRTPASPWRRQTGSFMHATPGAVPGLHAGRASSAGTPASPTSAQAPQLSFPPEQLQRRAPNQPAPPGSHQPRHVSPALQLAPPVHREGAAASPLAPGASGPAAASAASRASATRRASAAGPTGTSLVWSVSGAVPVSAGVGRSETLSASGAGGTSVVLGPSAGPVATLRRLGGAHATSTIMESASSVVVRLIHSPH